jgi:hypothetical protein
MELRLESYPCDMRALVENGDVHGVGVRGGECGEAGGEESSRWQGIFV